jgi:hypothetical protein
VVPKSVPSVHGEHREFDDPGSVRLAVMADLLMGLSDNLRREVIAEIPPHDRLAVVRLLAGMGGH